MPRLDARELWERRELVLHLAYRDFKVRYTQALLGVAWVVLQPLAAAAIFTLVIGRVLDAPTDGVPYFVFAYAGVAIWGYVSGAVEAASESLAGQSALVTRVYFPRLAAPLAAVLPGLVDLSITLIVLAVLVVIDGALPGLALVTLPLWIASALLLSVALGIWLSALNARYRDVRHALGVLFQLWFFVSPIAYASSVIDGDARFIYAINPLVGVLDGFRWAAVGGAAPDAPDLVSLFSAVALLVSGLVYFRRTERLLADVI